MSYAFPSFDWGGSDGTWILHGQICVNNYFGRGWTSFGHNWHDLWGLHSWGPKKLKLGQGGRWCQSRTKSATELLFSLESAHTWVISMGPVEFWKMKLSPKDSGRRMMIYRKSRYTLTQTQTVCQCALAPSSRSASAPSTAPIRSFK